MTQPGMSRDDIGLPRASDAEQRMLLRARQIIGMHGGLTPEAARTIAWMARTHGYEPARVMAAIRSESPSGQFAARQPAASAAPSPLSSQATSATELAPARDAMETPHRRASVWPVIGVVGLLGLALSLIVIAAAWPRPSAAAAPAEIAQAPPAPSPAAPPRARPVEPETPPPPSEPAARLDAASELAEATQLLRSDRDRALARFLAAIDALAGGWAEMTPARRRLAHASVVEFLYRSAPWPDVTEAAVRSMAQRLSTLRPDGETRLTADALAEATWSAGMLSRVSRERDLPAFALSPARRALAGVTGQQVQPVSTGADAFDEGVVLALLVAAETLATSRSGDGVAEAWERFVEIATIATPNASRRSDVLIAALGRLASLGADPVRSDEWLASFRTLVDSIEWGPESRARTWLVEAFDDETIDPPALWAITSALTHNHLDRGVDVTMTLRAGADPLSRAAMRDRYRGAWGLLDVGPTDELLADWIETARAALRETPSPDSASRLDASLTLARLSASGRLVLSGRFELSVAVMESVLEREPPERRPTRSALRDVSGDGDWALAYLSLSGRAGVERLRMIEQIGRRRQIGSVDAEVLVAEAVRGASRSIREAASQMARRFSDSPAVVNAMLEELPLTPATTANADLVAQLTLTPRMSPRRPDWRLESRRALVTRLLELLAGGGAWSEIDARADDLGRIYAVRAGLRHPEAHRDARDDDSSSSSGETEAFDASVRDEAPTPLAAGEFLRARWTREARAVSGSMGVELALRDRASRMLQARGPIQRFHAEQAAIVEMMALVVASERPDIEARVSETVAAFHRDRSTARDITEQILEGERAMLRLWMLRLSGGTP